MSIRPILNQENTEEVTCEYMYEKMWMRPNNTHSW
jgi:hypothetical protein